MTHSRFDIKNQVGIGNDNASVSVWINNGVYTELRKDVPSIIMNEVRQFKDALQNYQFNALSVIFYHIHLYNYNT